MRKKNLMRATAQNGRLTIFIQKTPRSKSATPYPDRRLRRPDRWIFHDRIKNSRQTALQMILRTITHHQPQGLGHIRKCFSLQGFPDRRLHQAHQGRHPPPIRMMDGLNVCTKRALPRPSCCANSCRTDKTTASPARACASTWSSQATPAVFDSGIATPAASSFRRSADAPISVTQQPDLPQLHAIPFSAK